MKIAVPYMDGKVNPAFGRSEHFKLYDIENGIIVSTAVIDNGGFEHTGLITHLKNNGVDLALVGNIGQHGADAFEAYQKEGKVKPDMVKNDVADIKSKSR